MALNGNDPDGQLSPTPEINHSLPSINNNSLGEYERRQLKLTKLSDLMLKLLPQYLYRVASDESRGKNLQGHYQAGSIDGYLGSANFYAFSKDDIRESLQSHVQNDQKASHWISFTSSMETIIDFALRMRGKGQKNIRIHVIDTTRLGKPAFIVHAYSMVTAFAAEPNRAPWFRAACMNTAQNEFLVWDELRVSADVVDFDKLLSPDIPRPNFHTRGKLYILRNIEKTPR